MPNVADVCLSDDDLLTEIGRILATGAMRIIIRKNDRAAKTRLAGGKKAGLIVRDGEHFADGGCPEASRSQISLN